MMACVQLFEVTLLVTYCSGDRVYSATHQLCSGHYSTDDFTDYLSVRSVISYRPVCICTN